MIPYTLTIHEKYYFLFVYDTAQKRFIGHDFLYDMDHPRASYRYVVDDRMTWHNSLEECMDACEIKHPLFTGLKKPLGQRFLELIQEDTS